MPLLTDQLFDFTLCDAKMLVEHIERIRISVFNKITHIIAFAIEDVGACPLFPQRAS